MRAAVVETSSLGDRSYLVHDGETGVVVDPQRDVDRILALAGRLGVRISHVAETHLHNDYVSGGPALCRLTGARYLVGAAEEVAFERAPVSDGFTLDVSAGLRLRAIATPGHTFHHLSYVFADAGGPVGVCTGGSLLFGTTGRTDLLGADHTVDLAHRQHASVRRLGDLLPDGVEIWPTHGFGSFCSAPAAGGHDPAGSTIGRERRLNPALRLHADAYVTQLLAGLGAYPAYYAHMAARNATGADVIDLTPPAEADPAELRSRITAGEWVVDLRSRKALATRHLLGTISFGLDGPLATWLGWLLPHGAPLTLLADTTDDLTTAQRELARIGIDRPAAAATTWQGGDPAGYGSLRTANFQDLFRYAGEPGRDSAWSAREVILDVRAPHEHRDGHIAGAVNIPLPELPVRLPEIAPGPVWVHCAAGYRAATGASLLARAGRTAIQVDDLWPHAEAAGLPIV